MVGPLNHVGVAVPSIEKAAQTYRDLYDIADITEPSEMPTQGVRFCFVNLENSQIELIEPFLEFKRPFLLTSISVFAMHF